MSQALHSLLKTLTTPSLITRPSRNKLEGTNFHAWKLKMLMMLEERDLSVRLIGLSNA